jgi:DNA-binding response OmpR family regulator
MMGEKSRTILCVEGAGAPRHERAAALERAGYTVILTHDEREALRVFISQQLDAVLLELRLGNGKKKSLRAEMNSIRPRVPIIALCPPDSKSSAARFFDCTFREGKGNGALVAILQHLLEGEDALEKQ